VPPEQPAPILGPRALNRAVLARQLLLDRLDGSVPEALQRICGIQAQYAPSTYLGLWSRLQGLTVGDVTAALENRTAVQGTLMRETIHVVARADFRPLAAAVRQERRRWFLGVRVTGRLEAAQRRAELADRLAALAARTRELLSGGPMRRADLLRELGIDAPLWSGVALWVDLVRVPPSGTWQRRRADLYGLADQWLGPPDDGAGDDEMHGRRLLVSRYLSAFGPASRRDVQIFTGLPLPTVDAVVADLPLRRLRTETGEPLLDVLDAPLPDPDTPAPVRFLPTYDATLLVHARRAQILPEPFRPLVFSSANPQSVPTFLVDGQVAGRWRFAGGRIEVTPFAELPARARAAVDDEAERLAAFHQE
jgi:hypothetical protein